MVLFLFITCMLILAHIIIGNNSTTSNHFLIHYDEKNDKNSTLSTVLNGRISKNDVFYAILGSSNDHGTKLHLDSFTALSNLFLILSTSGKGALLNTDASQHWQKPHEQMRSYWGNSEWLQDYGSQQLGVKWEKPEIPENGNFDYLGFVTFSWKDCIPSTVNQVTVCLHILQVRNTHSFFPDSLTIEEINPVLMWVRHKLDKHIDIPTIVAFQAIEDGYDDILNQFVNGLLKPKPAYNIVAILFGMMENAVKFNSKLCLSWGFEVPIIAMGTALPSDHYLLFQFGLLKRGFKNLYDVAAVNSTFTFVRDIFLVDSKCL